MSHDSIGMVLSLGPVRSGDTGPFGGPQDHGTIDDLDVAQLVSIAASRRLTSLSSHSYTAMITLLGPTI
jgi:hypothetical protein